MTSLGALIVSAIEIYVWLLIAIGHVNQVLRPKLKLH